jgi:lysozyme family protein
VNFVDAFKVVIGHEGGYVNNPDDPGGETKYGISKRAYPGVDIAGLTLDDARAIYEQDYWIPVRGDELPDAIALNVFDAAVNHGVRNAVRILQGALGVGVDGIMGPITFKAAWRVNPLIAAIRFNAARLEFYTTLQTFNSFGRGWVRRVADNLRSLTP